MGFRPAEQREQRNLGVKTACVIGLVRAPLEYRKAGEEGGAGNSPTWRSKPCRGIADDQAEGKQ